MKSENSKSVLEYEYRVNAEFKKLRLRVKKLEEIILGIQERDNGSISETVDKLKKG